ncbi:hypothetical protein [Modestobacter marinus]|uniref:hypothetical protein n=1 Tax=Modestobacter marinus TaxID=477641 RepID=UPI001C982C2A|nr:hypothetical protein [Modestobacter marinus]
MISIDFVATGSGIAAPTPAAGACTPAWTEQVVRMAPSAAPFQGTGLPVATTAVRLRDLAPDATGISTGTPASVKHQTRTGLASPGVPAQRTTPGDLPPEDPLS